MQRIVKNYGVYTLLVVFLFIQYFFIGAILKKAENLSPLIFEFYAGVMGSVITVGAMALIMRAQVKQETHKEYSAKAFDKKLHIYQQLLTNVFAVDDDQHITENEIHKIENQIGVACLVASKELVSILAQYMFQLKVYGVLYFRSLTPTQLGAFRELVLTEKNKPLEKSLLAINKYAQNLPVDGNEIRYFLSLDEFIQGLREDLAIIDGDVSHDIEHFVRTPINSHGLIPHPNKIDR